MIYPETLGVKVSELGPKFSYSQVFLRIYPMPGLFLGIGSMVYATETGTVGVVRVG